MPSAYGQVTTLLLQGYVTADVADAEGLHRLNLSGTKFRQLLRCAAHAACLGCVDTVPACVLSTWVLHAVNLLLANSLPKGCLPHKQ